MSRIGKQQIEIPEKTEVSILDGVIFVKGPGGELSKKTKSNILIEIKDKKVILSPKDETIETMSLWGTYASHIINMVSGVNTPFQKKLVIEGVGYKAALSEGAIVLNIGFSHPINIKIPLGINVSIKKNIITVSGIDKETVGQFTAIIRSKKKPEPYKGKGIRYFDEIIKRKEGKKSV